MRNLFIIVALILLSGCVTVDTVNNKVVTWKGEGVDKLVQHWGPPQREHTNQNGSKLYFYSSGESGVYSMQNNPLDASKGSTIHSYTSECNFSFTIENGIVTQINWRGHLNKCNKEAITNPTQVVAH